MFSLKNLIQKNGRILMIGLLVLLALTVAACDTTAPPIATPADNDLMTEEPPMVEEMPTTDMMTEEPTDETMMDQTAEPMAGQAAVTIVDSAFEPNEITVSRGTTVVWNQAGNLPHTVTADDGTFNSGTLNNGDTFEYTFTEAGIYPYYCEFHGSPGGVGMSGTVIVQ